MLQSTFIFLGGVATLLMLATIRVTEEETRLVFRLLSMILWLIWAIHATEVTSVSASGTTTEGYVSLMIVGIMMAAVMALAFVNQAFAFFGRDSPI